MTHSSLAAPQSLSTSVIVYFSGCVYVCPFVIWWVNISGSGAVCWWKECKNREITATLEQKSWRRMGWGGGGQSRMALSTHSSLQPSIRPSRSLCLSMAGSPIRSGYLNKMEFVKWEAATMAGMSPIQTSSWKVRIIESHIVVKKPWRETLVLFIQNQCWSCSLYKLFMVI